MLVSGAFSVVIYRAATFEVERFERIQRLRIEGRLRQLPGPLPVPPNPELLEETRQRILFLLVAINAGILVLAGGLGYVLAGRTLQPIQNMVEDQNQFITDSSHELRTPLTALKSGLEVNLRDKNLTLAAAKTVMQDSIGEVNRLQSLSDGLLHLAQYQTTGRQGIWEKISLTQVANQAIREVAVMAKQKKIVIDNQVSDATIKGEGASLLELAVILLDNALKYSPSGTTVTIGTAKTDGHIKLWVKDQGPGIGTKDLPHIWDRFYRADTARSSGGYGLGLAIAQKIVHTHQGTITVQSQVKKGTTFTVKLPVKSSAFS